MPSPSVPCLPERPWRTALHTGPRIWLASACVLGSFFNAGAVAGETPVTGAAATGKGWVAYVDGREVPMPAAGLNMGDAFTVARILDEGKNRNQVMAHLSHLSHRIGPRLTGSTRAKQACDWVRDQYAIWGVSNPRLDEWGRIPYGFDRGVSSVKLYSRPKETEKKDDVPADARTPDRKTDDPLRVLEFTTPAWTRGTDGQVRGRLLKEPATRAEFDAIKDRIKGSWILLRSQTPVAQRGVRSLVSARINARESLLRKSEKGEPLVDEGKELSAADLVWLEGPAGFLSASRDERVWTGPLSNWRELTADSTPRAIEVVVSRPDYDVLNSRLFDGEELELEVDLPHKLFSQEGGVPAYNVIAEIPGTTWPEQVVIVSAHLDSWDGPGSQGTTDNGTGSAVTMEAARILVAAGARPKRTIRFIHWTGEEQGLLGSAAYARKYADQLQNISAVFVDDGGTNFQGGLDCIPAMTDMLAAATAPVNNQFHEVKRDDQGRETLVPLNVNIKPRERMPRGGGSDHATFNAAGVPGFFWDEVGRADYGRGWHTQYDGFDLAVPEYLKQSATCSAITAYRLASADTPLPREKPAEKPADAPAETPSGAAAPKPAASGTGGNP